MRILLWHVHGSWATAFVAGAHTYLVPVTEDRGPYGLGRAATWDWPPSVHEVTPEQLRSADVDLVVLQRPEEEELAARWLGRRPGRDVPAVYVEHNAPHRGPAPSAPAPADAPGVPDTRHPMYDRSDLTLVHVTHFNKLFWDCGSTPTTVVEHGIPDPGPLWTGTVPRAAVVVNDPLRRGRTTGTDLLPALAEAAPLDVFGMRTEGLAAGVGLPEERCRTYDLPQGELHSQLASRGVYVHPVRWTSLGLSLLEAMHLGMPVVALATTEVTEAVPPEAGVVTNRIDELAHGVRRFLADPEEAARAGQAARTAALGRYSLSRFQADWDRLLKELTR
ncbi:glycosyltransferase [Streptomyces iconiensis]|uniref:Glycosyltransferase n=1 Tax=Streptomyces iconiensis TaxID=1384038 RepID=A0ABT6ZUU6_9ACTN|nr:glycosyltransferase [Streptomyces iconiensis]MDJ1132828.1 glycosyltransferase [Streptomyces iconiensis]